MLFSFKHFGKIEYKNCDKILVKYLNYIINVLTVACLRKIVL